MNLPSAITAAALALVLGASSARGAEAPAAVRDELLAISKGLWDALGAGKAEVWDRALADAAFDSEENHRLLREGLGVRSSVIPLNRRGRGRKWPLTRYRRQMVRRFRKRPRRSRYKRVYGQRWQAESAFSRHKRLLGDAHQPRHVRGQRVFQYRLYGIFGSK